MNRYNVITTIDIERQQFNEDGTVTIVTIPAGSVVNTVLWDGIAEWAPPESTRVEPA